MKVSFAAILAASQMVYGTAALAESAVTYYEAKVQSFGCSSIEAMDELNKVRSDAKAFQTALTEKQLNGDCVTILQGTQVEGSIEGSNPSVLRVNEKIEPPGYEAPAGDFQSKDADEKDQN